MFLRSADEAGPMMKNLLVLCVDDDEDTRAIISLCLGMDEKIQAYMAASGTDALKILASKSIKPDCFLLDVKLADCDGKDLMSAIRRMPQHAETPFIFLTASVGVRQRDEIINLGAVGMIAKPFDPLKLSFTVRSLLAKADGSA